VKLKYDFEIVNIDNQYIAVPVGAEAERMNGVFECNETAGLILKLLKNDITEAQIIAELEAEFSAETGVVAETVHAFIDKLLADGMLI